MQVILVESLTEGPIEGLKIFLEYSIAKHANETKSESFVQWHQILILYSVNVDYEMPASILR